MQLKRSLFAGLATAGLMVGGAHAAGFPMGGADPIYSSPLFNFEGFYVGATGGVGVVPVTGFAGTVGGVAGANFALTDAILAGVEFQGDTVWNGTGFVGVNALFLGKVGGYITDDMVVYGTGGGGWVTGSGSYALGAGIEMAVAEQISVRGEGLVTGSWGAWPDSGKATLGVLWHMN